MAATAERAVPAAAPGSDAPERPIAMRLEGLWKTYRNATEAAVKGLDLEIHDGEIVTLLGPSGCGKTTTLRLVAGLETADAGTILFGDRVIVDPARGISLPPDKRHVGMVFQSYAIWPHMTVEQNVAFPLKAQKKIPASAMKAKVDRALELVGMDGYQKRPAPLLSGGQQQRVALARALVAEPSVLLLDEPFSNLDAKLREQMRVEVKLLQKRVGVAVLFVTHDQTEALGLSDRIAVMKLGVIQQFGSPRRLYEQPANEFVRDFVGKTILFRGTIVSRDDDGVAVRLDGAQGGAIRALDTAGTGAKPGDAICVAIRPEDLDVTPATGEAPSGALTGLAEASLFVGERVEYQVRIEGQGTILIYGDRHDRARAGARAWLVPRPEGHTIWPITAAMPMEPIEPAKPIEPMEPAKPMEQERKA